MGKVKKQDNVTFYNHAGKGALCEDTEALRRVAAVLAATESKPLALILLS